MEVWEFVFEVVFFDKVGVFFDVIFLIGDDLFNWILVKEGDVKWMLENGVLIVKLGIGDIKIKVEFCDV